jgi:NAD(P)-dependent dehydrogenase (short-subunit alcohol dehydrogenase family)
MDKVAVVTGADRGLGYALTVQLLEQGWHVAAGQFMPDWPDLAELAARNSALHIVPLDVQVVDSAQAAAQAVAAWADHVDVLINNAGVIGTHASMGSIREPQDYAGMHRMYDVNALGPLRMVEAFLPLMEHAAGQKRLCFISSEAGSINRSRRTSWYGYCMSKAALNMAVRILFNHLQPEGFTFRVYHPGWVRSYMSGQKGTEADLEPAEAAVRAIPILLSQRIDEQRLVMVDYEGKEWPW